MRRLGRDEMQARAPSSTRYRNAREERASPTRAARSCTGRGAVVRLAVELGPAFHQERGCPPTLDGAQTTERDQHQVGAASARPLQRLAIVDDLCARGVGRESRDGYP